LGKFNMAKRLRGRAGMVQRSADYKHLYKTSRWQRLRWQHLQSNSLCVFCGSRGKIVLASVCDHVEPHKGDEAKFWAGPFQSLCAPCHNGEKKMIEAGKTPRIRRDIGFDGWPA